MLDFVVDDCDHDLYLLKGICFILYFLYFSFLSFHFLEQYYSQNKCFFYAFSKVIFNQDCCTSLPTCIFLCYFHNTIVFSNYSLCDAIYNMFFIVAIRGSCSTTAGLLFICVIYMI